MPSLVTYHVGNRNPSLAEQITIGGVAFNLSTSTVTFSMRLVGATGTAKVNAQAAVITDAANGMVRYDWASADVDTAGNYLCWWTVTTAGKTQDVGEALIEFLPHAPVARDYVELEVFKKTTGLDGKLNYDLDLKRAITSASRAITDRCDRRFDSFSDTRYYSPCDGYTLQVDDLTAITTVKTDNGGDGTFENTLVLNTDYTREPLNASSDGKPWTRLCIHPRSSFYWPTYYPRSVEIVGTFGWTAVPSAIVDATTLLAHRIVKRERESPAGIAGFGLDGAVVRVMANDPDVSSLIEPYARTLLIA